MLAEWASHDSSSFTPDVSDTREHYLQFAVHQNYNHKL